MNNNKAFENKEEKQAEENGKTPLVEDKTQSFTARLEAERASNRGGRNEEEKKEKAELVIKDLLHKGQIIKQILANRPDLQNGKGAALLRKCGGMSLQYVEKLKGVNDSLLNSKIVNNYSNSMSGKGKSLLDKPILKLNEELKTIPKSPEFKQIVYDLDIKEFLKKQGDEKSPSLNDILDSLIKVLKNLFQTKEQNSPPNHTNNKEEVQNHVPVSLSSSTKMEHTKIKTEETHKHTVRGG
jgi:hypothetical protein